MPPFPGVALSLSFLLFTAGPALTQGGSGSGRYGGPASEPPGQSITFGEHRLTLGMPKEEVLGQLGKSYELVRRPYDPKDDSWWVNQTSGETIGTIGILTFKGGALIHATRDWEIVEPQPGPPLVMMKTALAAFAQMIPGNPRDCEVSSDRVSGVVVTCGKMLVQLSISSSEGEPDRAFVYMVLGSLTAHGRLDGDVKSPSPQPPVNQEK